MKKLNRLLALTLVWTATLALALGGPVHLALAHAPHGHAHSHSQLADDHGDHPHTDQQHRLPVEHSSHDCSVCVLLATGSVLPASTAFISTAEPSLTQHLLVASIDLPAVDYQLPATRAPPAL